MSSSGLLDDVRELARLVVEEGVVPVQVKDPAKQKNYAYHPQWQLLHTLRRTDPGDKRVRYMAHIREYSRLEAPRCQGRGPARHYLQDSSRLSRSVVDDSKRKH